MKYRRQDVAGEGETHHVRHLRRAKGLAVVPTLFTLGNLLCGFGALLYIARGEGIEPTTKISFYAIAGYLIFAAMIFDMFDGFMARLTRSTSNFGAELDSLADMVSFGIAPAFLTLRLIGDLLRADPAGARLPYELLLGPLSDHVLGRLFWLIGAIYVACTALRLARFNVTTQHDVDSHMVFRGMPSPAAAALVVSSIIFFEALGSESHLLPFRVSPGVKETLRTVFPYILPGLLLSGALLMVSRFAYSHLINRLVRGRRRFNYVVRIVIVGLLLFWQPQITVVLAIYLYALSAPVIWLWRLMFKPRAAPAGMAGEKAPPG